MLPFALALLVVGACAEAPPPPGAPAPTEAPVRGDWLVFADTAEPTTLNCLNTTERPAVQVCRLVADSLVDFDDNLSYVPRLAESFSIAPDRLAITFHLRDGVRWHDGEPFTARDVTYSVEQVRRLDPGQERFLSQFGPLAEVTAPDPRTIHAVYSEVQADALQGWRDLLIQPAHLAYDPTLPGPLDRSPVGTGPFRFDQWIPQDRIILDANDHYFAGRPYLDRFVYRVVPSAEAVRAALETGEADIGGLSPDYVTERAGSLQDVPFSIVTYPAFMIEMIYWNLGEPRGLFRDARVRRALTMLLDRSGYVQSVHHGIYHVATTIIDPRTWGGDPRLAPWPFDPEGAALLLDESGVIDRDGDGVRDFNGEPFSFTLLYTTTAPYQRELASLMERAAAAAGIRVRLQGLEWAAMRPRMYAHDFEAAVYRWRLDPRPDPYSFFHSSQASGGQNLGQYRDAEFDRLSEEYRRMADPATASELLEAMQRRLHEDQPAAFVSIPGAVVAVHRRFHHPPIGPAGWWNWYPSLNLWYVPEGQHRYP